MDEQNRSDRATNVAAVDDIVERLRNATPYGLEDTCILADSADEIERLRSLSDQLAEALDVQCGLHRIPVTTSPYYTQHAKDALASWRKERYA